VGWTYKGYQYTNQVKDVLQNMLTDDFLVRYRLAEREIAQAQQFDIGIVGVISLQKYVISSCANRVPFDTLRCPDQLSTEMLGSC